jgi:ATP phosphoribosyltransferase regulatory subunit HisZ
MLDQDFCDYLEFQICKAFKHSADDKIEENAYLLEYIKDKKQITLKAFIGKDGQTEYELTLRFGKKALSRYAKNLDLKECIPNPEKQDWFYIDIDHTNIEIQLD